METEAKAFAAQTQEGVVVAEPKNLYNRMEWAGAFGDVGTLIPFVVAYIAIRNHTYFIRAVFQRFRLDYLQDIPELG